MKTILGLTKAQSCTSPTLKLITMKYRALRSGDVVALAVFLRAVPGRAVQVDSVISKSVLKPHIWFQRVQL